MDTNLKLAVYRNDIHILLVIIVIQDRLTHLVTEIPSIAQKGYGLPVCFNAWYGPCYISIIKTPKKYFVNSTGLNSNVF